SALWAKPGMGKTAAVLHTIAPLLLTGDVRNVLVIAPMRVARDVWPDEVGKWPEIAPIVGRIAPIVGTPSQRKAALAARCAVHTVNYENVPWLIEQMGGEWWFDTVVADEASKLRGFRLQQGTKRARAMAPFAHTRMERFIELTGTPAANSLTALWGQA